MEFQNEGKFHLEFFRFFTKFLPRAIFRKIFARRKRWSFWSSKFQHKLFLDQRQNTNFLRKKVDKKLVFSKFFEKNFFLILELQKLHLLRRAKIFGKIARVKSTLKNLKNSKWNLPSFWNSICNSTPCYVDKMTLKKRLPYISEKP
jgi:hypothetical protein